MKEAIDLLSLPYARAFNHSFDVCFIFREHKIPKNKIVLVTTTRNKATDSIVEKLTSVKTPVIVFGNEQRIGITAAKYEFLEKRLIY